MKRIALVVSLLLSAAAPALAEDPPEGGAWAPCSVSEITAYRDRLTISCAAPAGKGVDGAADMPRQFSVETRDALADNLLRLALEAREHGRPLVVLYVKSAAANPEGCDAETCRRAAAVTLK
ncbi:MAG: hypothetical protein KF842_11520 [Caulobacter sp.]|nr:hypothetical protein [Caulobacter sp.]